LIQNSNWEEVHILLRAFKADKKLEIWAKNKDDSQYKLFTTHDFCRLSGRPGPKRRQGDKQVPEGIYHIDRFNPKSKFFLSLGINYPNASDLIRKEGENPGGDIFIHGKCVTIGCIPITDPLIMELYILAEKAKGNGQANIQVQIFPTYMSEKRLDLFCRRYPSQQAFWKELKPLYDQFESFPNDLEFRIEEDGRYELYP